MVLLHSLFITALCLVFFGSSLFAQQSANTAGGDATGSGGSAAYSVGQVAYTANNGSSGSVSQGVQQVYDITVGIKETKLNIQLAVFPNPTLNNLVLQVKDYNQEKLTYEFFDIEGKLLEAGFITRSETQINTGPHAVGAYMLYIMQENKTIQSFKIIKN